MRTKRSTRRAQGERAARRGDARRAATRAHSRWRRGVRWRWVPTSSFRATLLSGHLYGRADFLRRVERPSALGAYSYEVLDTKLARSAKAKFAVQLAFYSDLLAGVQGVEPQFDASACSATAREVELSRAPIISHYFRQVARSVPRFRRRAPERHVSAAVLALPDLHVARRLRRALEGRRPSQPGRRHHAQPDRAPAGGGYEHAARRSAGLAADARCAARSRRRRSPSCDRRRRCSSRAGKHGKPSVEILALDRGAPARLPPPAEARPRRRVLRHGRRSVRGRGLEYLFGLRFVEDGKPRFKPIWAHDRAAERVGVRGADGFPRGSACAAFRRMHIYHYATTSPRRSSA